MENEQHQQLNQQLVQSWLHKRNFKLLMILYAISFGYSYLHYMFVIPRYQYSFIGSTASILQNLLAGIAPIFGILQLVGYLLEFHTLDKRERTFFFISAFVTLMYVIGIIMLIPAFSGQF